MAAPFRKDLVLEVHPRSAGLDELFRNPHGVDGVAVPCIRIRHHGDGDRVNDVSGEVEHFREGNEGHIGKAEVGGSKAETADLNCLKSRFFDKLC